MAKFKWTSNEGIATLILAVLSCQFIFFEGMEVSIPKALFMSLTPLLLLTRAPYMSKAIFLGGFFWVLTVLLSVLQFGPTRMSTFYYTAMFLSTFALYYNLVYIKKVFSLDGFLRVVKCIIYAYAICLVLQQMCILVGIRYMPLINLMGMRYYSLFHLNTLAIEPSHAARILTVYFYAFLKLLEYKDGRAPKLKMLWREQRWTVLAFLYTMVSIGSGTAFVGLGILALYFMRREYAVYAVVGASALYMLIPLIHYEPLERAVAVFNAALSGDTETVIKTDHSASARVNIILDTFLHLDVTDPGTWWGRGVDSSYTAGRAVVSAITDYGLFSYLSKLALFFSCCFTRFLSLEVLIFVLLFSLNVGNIAYGWACLMVFSTLKYFQIQYKK